jgi:hypothetical protein
MSSRRSLVVLTLVFGALALVSAPPAGAAPSDDACSLLTQAQVSAVVGVPVGAGTHVTPTYVKTCTWTPASGASQDVKAVTISFQVADKYEATKRLMEQSEAMATGTSGGGGKHMTSESASGIGDDAFYSVVPGSYTGLLVKKGNTSFKVAIYGNLPTEKMKAMEKSLALDALSKL